MAELNLNDISSNSDGSRELEANDSTELVEYKPLKRQNIISKGLDKIGVNTDIGGAGGTIWEDVIKPTFLDVCRDIMYAAADYFFGGVGGGRRSSQGKKNGKNGNYTSYSSKSTQKTGKKLPSVASYYMEFDKRRAESEDDDPGAEDVRDSMVDVIDASGSVSIQDMITLAGKSTTNYTLADWGWTDMSRAMVRRNSNGSYYIDLPKPIWIRDL